MFHFNFFYFAPSPNLHVLKLDEARPPDIHGIGILISLWLGWIGWKGTMWGTWKSFCLCFLRDLSPKTCQCFKHHSNLPYQLKNNLSKNIQFSRRPRGVSNIETDGPPEGWGQLWNWSRCWTRLVLWHHNAWSIGWWVSAGRGGPHQKEAGAHHGLVLLHHDTARGWACVAKTFLKLAIS